jgi:hypothetical protein
MKKNNYIILILFIIFICYILFTFITKKREGFTQMDKNIGEYQYLAPIPEYNTWSDTTIDEFSEKFYQVTNFKPSKQFVMDQYIKIALEEEAKYYISNGIFPVCPYIINYCNNEPTTINKLGLDASGNPITLEMFQKFQPNRFIYMVIIFPIQEKMDPQPDACLIFLGKKEPPTYSSDTINKIMSYFG